MAATNEDDKGAADYHGGSVDTVISVEDVIAQAEQLGDGVSAEEIEALCAGEPFVRIDHLNASYGKMRILHDVNLQVGAGQSLCLIGPNGAGKSTILHAIFGFKLIFSGSIQVGQGSNRLGVTRMSSNNKLKEAGIAYILQDKSVFPDMTVEENLWMGGYLMDTPQQAREAAERVF